MSKLGNLLTNVVIFSAGFIVGAACYAAAIEASDEKYFDDPDNLDTDDLDNDDINDEDEEIWGEQMPAESCEGIKEDSRTTDESEGDPKNSETSDSGPVEEALRETINEISSEVGEPKFFQEEETVDSSSDEK